MKLSSSGRNGARITRGMPLRVSAWACAGLFIAVAGAQTQSTLPPKPVVQPADNGAYNYLYQAGWVCGAGASTSSIATRPTLQCGGEIAFLPFLNLEAGVMGSQANQSAVSGYFSTNFWAPLKLMPIHENKRDVPLLFAGYTRMFETGHALNYGFGYAHTVNESHSLQFEVRDYWAFSHPDQHNVVFRVVWLVGLPD